MAPIAGRCGDREIAARHPRGDGIAHVLRAGGTDILALGKDLPGNGTGRQPALLAAAAIRAGAIHAAAPGFRGRAIRRRTRAAIGVDQAAVGKGGHRHHRRHRRLGRRLRRPRGRGRRGGGRLIGRRGRRQRGGRAAGVGRGRRGTAPGATAVAASPAGASRKAIIGASADAARRVRQNTGIIHDGCQAEASAFALVGSNHRVRSLSLEEWATDTAPVSASVVLLWKIWVNNPTRGLLLACLAGWAAVAAGVPFAVAAVAVAAGLLAGAATPPTPAGSADSLKAPVLTQYTMLPCVCFPACSAAATCVACRSRRGPRCHGRDWHTRPKGCATSPERSASERLWVNNCRAASNSP